MGLPDGEGTFTSGQNVYEGSFKNGKRDGQGKLNYGLTQEYYHGNWANDHPRKIIFLFININNYY